MRCATSSPAFHELDPAVVCGLIRQYGDAARSATYDAGWERDHETWRQVQRALDDAREGERPAATSVTPPSWLIRLVRQHLDRLAAGRTWDGGFETIRALERLGLVTLEADDTYVLAVVATNGDRFSPLRADHLRADPDLLDKVVWRMFEVEGGGEISLTNVDKYSLEKNGWKQAFLDLVADGTLPRERVLTSALDALNRDFSAYRAGWYSRLYDALAPTTEELAAHQDRLRRLLRSETAALVTFAVTRLRSLSRAGLLDDAACVPALGPALLAPVKGTALGAVRLLDEIATRAPNLRGAVADVAGTGLGHPHADVQQAAATALTKLGAGGVVEAVAEELAPSVRARLGLAVPEGASPSEQELAVLDGPVASLEPAGPDDVLDRFAALLEDASDPVEIELVLAGLAAAGDRETLSPLVKRARTVFSRGPGEMLHVNWLRGQLARLVLVTAGQNANPLKRHRDPINFLVLRVNEVGRMLTGKDPARPLLATPEDPAGWLTPRTLVERLAAGPEVPARCDVIAALLRLHPDGRSAALSALTADPDRVPASVRDPVVYALGGPPPAAGIPQAASALWVAASRARTPLGDDAWLEQQGIPGAGRSRALSTALHLRPSEHVWTDARGPHTTVSWHWTLSVDHPANRPDDEPTATAGHGERPNIGDWGDNEDFVGWQALIWPHDAERFLVDGIHPVLEAATSHEVKHDAVRVLDALVRHPGHLDHLAWTTLAAGLTTGRADERARSVDAVVSFSGSGRLTAAQLARGLADLAAPGNPTRWAGSLADVAASGRTGRQLVIQALGLALPDFDPARRGLHALLELLREELLREQAPTPAHLTPWLTRIGGTSRTATAARALLEGR